MEFIDQNNQNPQQQQLQNYQQQQPQNQQQGQQQQLLMQQPLMHNNINNNNNNNFPQYQYNVPIGYENNSNNQQNNINNNFQNNSKYYQQYNGQFQDEEQAYNSIFDNRLRMQFIRKVYLILLTQISITAFFVYYSATNKLYQEFEKRNSGLLLFCVSLTLILCYTLVCFRVVARTVPLNYIILFSFTICGAYCVGYCVLSFPAYMVLEVEGLTLAVFVALTAYSFYAETDFTVLGGLLFTATLFLIVSGIMLCIFPSKISTLIYSCLGLTIFTIYLILDTQLLLIGHRYYFGIDDYVIAAIQIYIDIMYIFLRLLYIIGSSG